MRKDRPGMSRELGHLIKQIHCKLQAEADADMKCHGLTFTQAHVLRYLGEHQGEATQKDLERYLKISHPSVVGLVQRLEAKGFVSTEISEDDRRIKIVRATKKARQFGESIFEEMNSRSHFICAGLSEEELSELIRMLRIVQSNVDNLSNRKTDRR